MKSALLSVVRSLRTDAIDSRYTLSACSRLQGDGLSRRHVEDLRSLPSLCQALRKLVAAANRRDEGRGDAARVDLAVAHRHHKLGLQGLDEPDGGARAVHELKTGQGLAAGGRDDHVDRANFEPPQDP